ncbi:MAG: GspE/PulE family protein [Verrucomicrobiota bacterium]
MAALAPPPMAPPSGPSLDLSSLVGDLMSLEGTAVQYGLLPVELPREACSIEAETLIRRVGKIPHTAEPWLPVSTLGPLLIFAHHRPTSQDFWGIPEFMAVQVIISKTQYEAIRSDLIARVSAAPFPNTASLEGLPHPQLDAHDYDGAFHWLLENYPFDEKDREKLRMHQAEAMDKSGYLETADYDKISTNLGVAIRYLIEGKSLLCFNPEDAPRQDDFPTALLEKHCVFPLYIGEHKAFLLSASDDNFEFEDEWLSQGNDPITFATVLADTSLIKKTISRSSAHVTQAGIEVEESTLSYSDRGTIVEIIPEDLVDINPQNLDNDPETLVHWVLNTAISAGASDLHLEKYYNVARFRARIDGRLTTLFTAPEDMMQRFVALIKNYSNMSQTRQEVLDGRFALALGRRRVDARVAAVPCRNDLQKLVMRFLDKQDGVKELSELNLSRRQNMITKKVMGRDQGLVLITGPTGSGKTTTLYALINSVNEEGINIHTIEDPIEYEIEGINQTQINTAHDLTFSAGLRSLLRSDPDVILIGECRDEETANSAVNAALTGHLVLTTLHANDSLRAISRLLSLGVEPHLVGDSLAMTQAQRLVRRLCNYCKRPFAPTEEIQQIFINQGIQPPTQQQPIFQAVGCTECRNTGYSGRVALMEMCEITSDMADMVERGASQSELRKVAVQAGFLTLYQEGLTQVLAGQTTIEEIKKVSYTAF